MTPDPIRIQRLRLKGWRMPSNTVYVGRPSRFGNPFYLLSEEGYPLLVFHPPGSAIEFPDQPNDLEWDAAERMVVDLFRERCVDKLPSLAPLRGKNLACWCALDKPCHADILLDLANSVGQPVRRSPQGVAG